MQNPSSLDLKQQKVAQLAYEIHKPRQITKIMYNAAKKTPSERSALTPHSRTEGQTIAPAEDPISHR